MLFYDDFSDKQDNHLLAYKERYIWLQNRVFFFFKKYILAIDSTMNEWMCSVKGCLF